MRRRVSEMSSPPGRSPSPGPGTPARSPTPPPGSPPSPRNPHSVEQQSAEVINAVLGNIFSTRRPRDVCAGAASAFKSIAKGVALGFAALIAAPVAGAYGSQDDGDDDGGPGAVADASAPATQESKALAKKKMLRGVAAGVGAGLCGALLLPLTGVVVGVGQICRGCWNTPSALYHAAVGDLEWDKESREWKEREAYVLSAEAEVVRREAASEGLDVPASLLTDGAGGAAPPLAAATAAPKRKKRVASLEYYDLLEIQPDASPAQVKKAYYKVARGCHPDKCGDDPTAHAKFQAVSHAYQVLSDPQLRAAYDRDGASATAEVGFQYDAAVFFAALFGSQRFEAYVGELALAQISSTLTKRGGAAEAASKAIVTSEETGERVADGELGGAIAQGLAEVRGQHGVKQRGREVGLATTLAAALEPFVKGDAAAFDAWCAAEAEELAVADGDEALTKGALILALARGYGLAADEWLGRHDGVLGIAGVVSSYKNDAFKNLAYANAARAGAQGLYAAKKLSELVPVDKEAAHIEEVEVEVDDETPAARSDLAALGVGKLKALAKRHRVDVSGCVEKAHLVDALLAAHVPLPKEAKPAEAAPSAADARKKQTEEAYKASMPIFLEAMLRVSLVDVHETVRNVCAKVLADEALDLEGRRKRARGLKLFSAALFAAKRDSDRRAKSRPKPPADAAAATGDEGEAKDESARRIEHAVNVTMAAAMGQELSEDHGKHMPPPGGDAF